MVLCYGLRKALGEDSYSKLSVPRDVPVQSCRSRVILSMEGEAAQERRVVVCIARGINWLSVDCQHAIDHSIERGYSGRTVGCITTWTFHETAAPGKRHFGQGAFCR